MNVLERLIEEKRFHVEEKRKKNIRQTEFYEKRNSYFYFIFF